jgi:PWWP domain
MRPWLTRRLLTVSGSPSASKPALTAQAAQANGAAATPSSRRNQRKSTGGGSAKKLSRKKSIPDLHTDVKPGEYWFVRMKGYAPWPAIICNEKILPAPILERRPVSAQRPDGSWRFDFDEGGKNIRDRRYPVMFLGTNEL